LKNYQLLFDKLLLVKFQVAFDSVLYAYHSTCGNWQISKVVELMLCTDNMSKYQVSSL